MTDTEIIEECKVVEGVEATPIIVLTGTLKEYHEFQHLTGRNKDLALAVRQPHQLSFYPNTPIYHWGTYWLNEAYASPEYQDFLKKVKLDAFLKKEAENNA